MAKIGRSFDELDGKIKALNENLKTADKEVRKLDNDLKINPGNVDAVRQNTDFSRKICKPARNG